MSRQVKNLAVWGLVLLVGAAQAQVTTTETLNFDNNLMPGGWSIVNAGGVVGGLQIANERLEVFDFGQGTYSMGIAKPIDTSGVTQIRIEYDANLANVYWGQGTGPILTSNIAHWSDGFVYFSMSGSGLGQDSMNFHAMSHPPGDPNPGGFVFQNIVSPAVWGSYHMNALFEDGQISNTITNLTTGATFSSGMAAVSGLLLSDMHGIVLHGSTHGEISWIDNASISITSAVPEPESYALLLAGLGMLGAVGRRRQQPIRQI